MTEPERCNYWSPYIQSLFSSTREVTTRRSLCTMMKSSLHSPHLEKPRVQQQWPSTTKIKETNFFFKKRKMESVQDVLANGWRALQNASEKWIQAKNGNNIYPLMFCPTKHQLFHSSKLEFSWEVDVCRRWEACEGPWGHLEGGAIPLPLNQTGRSLQRVCCHTDWWDKEIRSIS